MGWFSEPSSHAKFFGSLVGKGTLVSVSSQLVANTQIQAYHEVLQNKPGEDLVLGCHDLLFVDGTLNHVGDVSIEGSQEGIATPLLKQL
jgi:hypothetical protein